MAQDYDNMGKKLWAYHAEDLSRFVLNVDDVEVLADLGTEQQIIRTISFADAGTRTPSFHTAHATAYGYGPRALGTSVH